MKPNLANVGLAALLSITAVQAATEPVTLLRTPESGIQPQAAVDA